MDIYLSHYGILGQKWGVRRYQNEDGTLTEAGKRRVKSQKIFVKSVRSAAETASSITKDIPDARAKVVARTARAIANNADLAGKKYDRERDVEVARRAKTMTDEELRAAINRMQMEDTYRTLSKKDRDAGMAYVRNIGSESVKDIMSFVTPIAATAATLFIERRLERRGAHARNN